MWALHYADKAMPQGTPICQVASSNYVAMFGTSEPGVLGEGLYFRNSCISEADITDGTSQTIAAGERAHVLGQATWVGSVTNASLGPPPDYDGSVGTLRIEPGAGMTLGHAGEGKSPGARSSDCNQFYSRHSGRGVNFVFADGHVSFLKTSMDYRVFAALATRAGAESIDGDY
jgi:prepilin-type processing-associated H-X9-DG protein